MTSYAIDYTPEAEDQLTLYWLSAADRQAITAAQYQVDERLSHDPRNPGREFREGMWEA
jgi:hypothetical protein